MKTMMFVEDTYGVVFHRILLDKLAANGILPGSARRLPVRRMPSKKCNQALYRKIMGYFLRHEDWKTLIVIDSERRTASEAAETDVVRHFKRWRDRVRVAVVEPMHEAWLCIGLCEKTSRCRSDPVAKLTQCLGRFYEKRDLELLAGKVDIRRLLGEEDFRRYVDLVRWLLGVSVSEGSSVWRR